MKTTGAVRTLAQRYRAGFLVKFLRKETLYLMLRASKVGRPLELAWVSLKDGYTGLILELDS